MAKSAKIVKKEESSDSSESDGSDSGSSSSGSGSSSGSDSDSDSGSGSGSGSGSTSGSESEGEEEEQEDEQVRDMAEDPRDAAAARSVLPRTYEVPSGYEAVGGDRPGSALAKEVLDSAIAEGKELWLFRVPASLDFATLSGATLELRAGDAGNPKVGDAVGAFGAGGKRRATIRAAASAELDMTRGLLYCKQREALVLAPPFSRNFDVVAPLSEPTNPADAVNDAPAPFAERPVPVFSCYQPPPQKIGMRQRFRVAGAGTLNTLSELSAPKVMAPTAADSAAGAAAGKKTKTKKRALSDASAVAGVGATPSKKKKAKKEKKEKQGKNEKKSKKNSK